MPAAINGRTHPQLWHSNVGQRKLPCSDLEYYARAPTKTTRGGKNGIFKTCWLPVNASCRVVADRQQDIMYMKYAGHLDRLNKQSDTSKLPLRQSCLPVSYELTRKPLPRIELEPKPVEVPEHVKLAMWKTDHNSMAPFASLGKPTCGFFFTRNISHKKRLIGINATNTVKWRSNVDVLGMKKKQ